MKPKTILIISLLIVLFSIPLFSLFYPGLPITHDGQDHVARIANFYQSLSEGNIVPRWAANLNWGYGHPILMFLYPLPSYFASLFHFVGFSFADSTKLIFGLSFLASAIFMYLWAKKEWGKGAGFIAATAYTFAPYRFVDLYVRGALGEHVAFAFMPLVLYGILIQNAWVTAIAMASLILSHNAISLMFLPIICLYLLHRSQFLFKSLWFLFLGFAISAFFWLPAFAEGKYTLRDIVTSGAMTDRFVPWTWFFYSPWNWGGGNEFTKEIGYIGWLGILGGILLLFRKIPRKTKLFITGAFSLFFMSLFLMTVQSQFIWNSITLLQKFQFPWRFLTLSVFTSSALVGLVFSKIPKKLQTFTTIGILVLAISTYQMWQPKDYLQKPESFYTGVYAGTTDTGESSPVWSVRFMEHEPLSHIQVLSGSAQIKETKRITTKHEYKINAVTKSRILENTLYFPGWKVFVDGKNTLIEFQDPANRGLVTFWVDSGEHNVEARFTDTKLRKFANMISLGGILVILGSIVWQRKYRLH